MPRNNHDYVDGQTTVEPHREGARLERAGVVIRHNLEDIRAISEGLANKITDLGLRYAHVTEPQGFSEHTLHFLGQLGISAAQHKFDYAMQIRLRSMTPDKSLTEISELVKMCIIQLGESEKDYSAARDAYIKDIDQMQKKLAESTPLYIEARTLRLSLETQVQTIEGQLRDVDEEHRPQMLKDHEDVKRHLHDASADESRYFTVIKESNQGLPTIQVARDGAVESIRAIYSMRLDLLEKFQNLRVLMEHALAAPRAKARIEAYQAVDKAFNQTTKLLLENSVVAAGAATETNLERLRHAAVDPLEFQRLLYEFLDSVNDYAKGLEEVKAVTAKAPGAALLTDESGHPVTIDQLEHKQEEALPVGVSADADLTKGNKVGEIPELDMTKGVDYSER